MYKIVRFICKEWGDVKRTTIKKGLTLQEAQAHCQREDTHGVHNGHKWFDGYEQE